jgi:hypothetical protein
MKKSKECFKQTVVLACFTCYECTFRKCEEDACFIKLARRDNYDETPTVSRGTFRIYAQSLYPSQERVRLLLTKPGSIKELGALAAWHEALQELGLENKEP